MDTIWDEVLGAQCTILAPASWCCLVPTAASYLGGIRSKQAMVLIGLIIIAVALMALLVLGVELPDSHARALICIARTLSAPA